MLHRTDNGYWHVVAGVVEPAETYADAAARELFEESGLEGVLVDLEHPVTYPVTEELREAYGYPADVSEVVVQSFAAEAPPDWEPVLNEEHDEYRWCTVEEAMAMLYWPEAREAVRILARRLAATTP